MTLTSSVAPRLTGRSAADILTISLGIAGVVAAFLLFMPLSPVMPQNGLDGAWAYALNDAVARHLVFGRDVIFTFGPWASVFTQVYHPRTDTLMLVGCAIVTAGLCSGFALLAGRRRVLLLLLLPLVLVEASSRDAVLMVIPLLLVLVVLKAGSPVAPGSRIELSISAAAGIFLLICATAMLPLIKGSFAGAAFFEGAVAIAIAALNGRRGLAAAIGLIAILVLAVGWVAAGQPLSALPHFFMAQRAIISGYTEAMAIRGPHRAELEWLVAALVLAALFEGFARHRPRAQAWLARLALVFYLFVSFKAGFVRQDLHVGIAAGGLLLTALAFTTFLRPGRAIVLAGVVVLGWSSIESTIEPFNLHSAYARLDWRVRLTASGVEIRTAHGDRLPAMFELSNTQAAAAAPLPQVPAGADIYPVDMGILLANGITWTGRPILQSYSAYTQALDALNASHLATASAPHDIFLTVAPIDGHLATTEDSGSWPLLLGNYSTVGEAGDYIHLIRSNQTPPPVRPISRVSATLDQEIDVPADRGFIRAAIDLQPTVLGRLALILFKAPQLSIELTLDNGATVSHRYIRATGETGFLLSPYIASVDDYLCASAGLPECRTVRSLKVTAASGWAWSKNFAISFSALDIPADPGARPLFLRAPSAPPEPILSAHEATQGKCHLDSVDGKTVTPDQREIPVASGGFGIDGWATPDAGHGVGPDETWVMLTGPAGNRTFYKPRTSERPDVNAAFGQPAMKDSGYVGNFDISALSGRQILTIYTLRDGKAFVCPDPITLLPK
jgi:hypothetical protein